MRYVAFAVLVAAFGSTASAMSEREICEARGRLVEHFARMRDAGKSEKEAAAEARRELRKLGPSTGDMREYVALVYSRRDVPASKFRLAAEVSCLRGD